MAYLLHQLLSDSAARDPEAEAVRSDGESLSYGDLETRANQLARSLVSAGVRRGDRVGIYLHKSIASIVAVFAIMKTGACYVPLDPNAPAKRLAYITGNCGIRVLVSAPEKQADTVALLGEETPVEVVAMIGDAEEEPAEVAAAARVISWQETGRQDPEGLPDPGAIESDLAYILYTSGSTGMPKGVMITHRNALTFVDWAHATFGLRAEDRITSHAPLHFDLSVFDIFATVKAGAAVVLVPENVSIFPVRLADLLQDERVTITYLVPSILTMMVSHGDLEQHDFSALRAVLFAGEVFPIKNLRGLAQAVPGIDYYNLYGPTETNVCTYYKVCDEDLDPDRTEPVPIGIPCENTAVFAVDEDGELVTEIGKKGELWVRGPCVAKGYWGDADKTSKAFVGNRFEARFEETAYRTGDVVRLAEDGANWLYNGRRDQMVKCRGYRIELGEVETAILDHAEVGQAAVVAVPDEMVGNRLKAFVVADEACKITERELGRHCGEYLPRYMIPESIEFLDTLPTTSTGKIDRVRLQQLAADGR